jgi:hypothetical protein
MKGRDLIAVIIVVFFILLMFVAFAAFKYRQLLIESMGREPKPSIVDSSRGGSGSGGGSGSESGTENRSEVHV